MNDRYKLWQDSIESMPPEWLAAKVRAGTEIEVSNSRELLTVCRGDGGEYEILAFEWNSNNAGGTFRVRRKDGAQAELISGLPTYENKR